jgi:hypothetical protein
VSIIPTVELHRYTMAELYELRRVIIKHSRSMPPGPARNDHRRIATLMRALSRDGNWLAVHTVPKGEKVVAHEVHDGRMIPDRAH